MHLANATGPRGHIGHIVILMQEGRTLNNLFTGWPHAFAPGRAFALNIGLVFLKAITYSQDRSMCELSPCMNLAYSGGQMNGFDINRFCKLGCTHSMPYRKGRKPDVGLLPYSYMDHTQIAPYREIAGQYVLADNMYATGFDGDFSAHQDLIAGSTFVTANRALRDVPSAQPWGCDAPKGTRIALWGYPYETVSPCVTQYPTMAELLDRARLSWKYYVAPLNGSDPSGRLWNAFDAIKKVRYSSDWTKNIVSPPGRVLTDARNGTLPSVAWVIPEVAWSDHPSQTDDKGPSWVASVVNAIGTAQNGLYGDHRCMERVGRLVRRSTTVFPKKSQGYRPRVSRSPADYLTVRKKECGHTHRLSVREHSKIHRASVGSAKLGCARLWPRLY